MAHSSLPWYKKPFVNGRYVDPTPVIDWKELYARRFGGWAEEVTAHVKTYEKLREARTEANSWRLCSIILFGSAVGAFVIAVSINILN